MDNIEISIENVKILFTEFRGTNTNIWIIIPSINISTAEGKIQSSENETSKCDKCYGYEWPNTSVHPSGSIEVRKQFGCGKMNIYVQEFDEIKEEDINNRLYFDLFSENMDNLDAFSKEMVSFSSRIFHNLWNFLIIFLFLEEFIHNGAKYKCESRVNHCQITSFSCPFLLYPL